MRKQITVVFLLGVFLLTGCTDANSTEVQQMLSSEQTEEAVSEEINLEETNVMEGERGSEEEITDEQEDTEEEESVTSSEHIEMETTTEPVGVYRNIPIEEVVYEENDVVFVIAKRGPKGGSSHYGYLISVGGKVVPFQVSYDDYFSEEMGADFGRALDMETAEPIVRLEDSVIKYYIEKLNNVDESKEMNMQFYGYCYEYEHISIDGRRVDGDKYVDCVDLYSLDNCILEPTDPNAIELMDWLLELNEMLIEESNSEDFVQYYE